MQETIIDVSHFESILNPIYIPYLYNKKRYLILYGGSGAGKSHFACQKILHRTMTEEGHRFLIIRKVARTLRRSVFQLFIDYIAKWGLLDEFNITKAEMTIAFKGDDNMILFAGIDDSEKMKSIERVTSVWVEEATELAAHDFEELDRRVRAIYHTYVQFILTYNPIGKNNWTYKRFFENITKDEEVDIAKLCTTYKNNVFILDDKAYVKLLESYKGNTRTVYTLGHYGQLENAIYTNWQMIDDKDFPDSDEAIYGLDFGFIAPNALVKMVVDMEEKKIYLHEEIYKTRQTTAMLATDMEDLGIKDKRIIADSEAPEKIEELKGYGFSYIEGANKGKGSVIAGIDFINQFTIYITKSSTNIKKEIEGYQRHKDKDGNIYEQPEKGMDHLMDAFRYPVYTVYYLESEPYFIVNE